MEYVVFKNKQARRGVTLIEMILVMAILGLLIAGIVTYGVAARKKAKISKAKNEMRAYSSSIMQYHDSHKLDSEIAKRWPAKETDPSKTSACTADGGKFAIPPAIKDEGFWRSGDCVAYDYDINPATEIIPGGGPVPYIEVTLTWPGLDNNIATANDNVILVITTSTSRTGQYKDDPNHYIFAN